MLTRCVLLTSRGGNAGWGKGGVESRPAKRVHISGFDSASCSSSSNWSNWFMTVRWIYSRVGQSDELLSMQTSTPYWPANPLGRMISTSLVPTGLSTLLSSLTIGLIVMRKSQGCSPCSIFIMYKSTVCLRHSLSPLVRYCTSRLHASLGGFVPSRDLERDAFSWCHE